MAENYAQGPGNAIHCGRSGAPYCSGPDRIHVRSLDYPSHASDRMQEMDQEAHVFVDMGGYLLEYKDDKFMVVTSREIFWLAEN